MRHSCSPFWLRPVTDQTARLAGGATTARVRLRRAARDAGPGSTDQDGQQQQRQQQEEEQKEERLDDAEMEDGFASVGEGDEGAQQQQKQKQQARRSARGKGSGQACQQQQAELGPRPDRRSDYRAWVAWQKQKWRQVRQERKRRKVEAAKRTTAAAGAADREPAAVGGGCPWVWRGRP